MFLWPDPAGTWLDRQSLTVNHSIDPPRVLPGIVLYGVRTFLWGIVKTTPSDRPTDLAG